LYVKVEVDGGTNRREADIVNRKERRERREWSPEPETNNPKPRSVTENTEGRNGGKRKN
jgi:hypothetical protein